MFDSIKAFGEVFKGTFLVFPDKDHPSRDAEVVFYLGEHEDGISKGKAEELLGPAVWTGRISGDKTISTKGILGDVTRWNQLSGAMNVSIADYVMGKSIEAFGPFGIKEADDDFNAIARTCIQGMVSFYGAPLMGFVNIHKDGDREAVTGGDKSPFFAVPEKRCNFCADFILPPETEGNSREYRELADLLRYWNATAEQKAALLKTDLSWYAKDLEEGDAVPLVEDILNRIGAVGGRNLLWV